MSIPMQTTLGITQIIANIATVLGLIGVGVAYWQLRAGAIAQKQTTAVAAWNEYLRLALAHPALSRPASGTIGSSFSAQEYSRYRWFVAAMLFACEQALEAHPGDSAWEAIVKAQLRYHHAFLQTKQFDPAVYSMRLRQLAAEVRAEPVRPLMPQSAGGAGTKAIEPAR